MNINFIVGAAIALGWFLYRWYKGIIRRCSEDNCGSTRVKRIGKIVLALDEKVSFRSPKGQRRWCIRRVVRLTFTRCRRRDKHHGHDWTKLVRIDYDPLPVWYAYFIKWLDKSQFVMEEWPFIEATERRLRELYLSGAGRHNVEKSGHLVPRSQSSDTPPVSLYSLFADYLKEFSEAIAGEEGHL